MELSHHNRFICTFIVTVWTKEEKKVHHRYHFNWPMSIRLFIIVYHEKNIVTWRTEHRANKDNFTFVSNANILSLRFCFQIQQTTTTQWISIEELPITIYIETSLICFQMVFFSLFIHSLFDLLYCKILIVFICCNGFGMGYVQIIDLLYVYGLNQMHKAQVATFESKFYSRRIIGKFI